MRLTFRQELRQELRLTPQLIQSMEILQLPVLQLEQRISEELEQNPLLEIVQEIPDDDHAERDGKNDAGNEDAIADEFAQNFADTIDEEPVRSQNWLEEYESRRADTFANIEGPSETLQEHLEKQLDWFDLSEPMRAMVLRIIHHLEPSGYFADTLENFLGEEHTDDELSLARKALALVQRLEPSGVGGVNLHECLLLQINPDSENAEVLRVLITSYLDYISSNRLSAIAKKSKYSLETIQSAVSELRQFNPRPGIDFEPSRAAVVIPDIFIEKHGSGKYVVRLEDARIPQLRISEQYDNLIKKRDTDKTAKSFIRKNRDSARWLIEAIAQRRETLFKVSQAIVDHQAEFFDQGPQALKPLKMQQIADTVGIHVGTVSRACDEKWVSSPQGIFPLQRLFAGGIASSDGGENVANDAVRSKIQEIINKENKKSPLTDDAIVAMLESDGIQVARRTIAKYRDILGIPSSRGRRQWET